LTDAVIYGYEPYKLQIEPPHPCPTRVGHPTLA